MHVFALGIGETVKRCGACLVESFFADGLHTIDNRHFGGEFINMHQLTDTPIDLVLWNYLLDPSALLAYTALIPIGKDIASPYLFNSEKHWEETFSPGSLILFCFHCCINY